MVFTAESVVPDDEIGGLLKMARLNAVPMGAGLVGLGAFGARSTIPSSGPTLAMWAQLGLGMLLTIIVTTGSMLIKCPHEP